jgi:hypothetical protein
MIAPKSVFAASSVFEDRTTVFRCWRDREALLSFACRASVPWGRDDPINRHLAAFVVLSAVAITAFVGLASAHQINSARFSAPIPLWLLFAGAGATVAATALLVGLIDTAAGRSVTNRSTGPISTGGSGSARGSRSTEATSDPAITDNQLLTASIPSPVARGLRYVASGLFLVAVTGAIALGLVGTQANAESLATTFVWPVWLKGIGVYAILFGSPWTVLSPWRTIYDGLCRLEGEDIMLAGRCPDRLGRWPALVGFVVWIGVFENLTIVPRSPRVTAVVVAGYAIVMVIGALLFGREWFRRADAFSVLYGLFGRVASIDPRRRADGGYRVVLRPPWSECTDAVADMSFVAFAVAAVYTVSFDGFTSTSTFQTVLFGTRNLLGVGSAVSVLLYLVGLGGFVVAFLSVGWVMSAIADGDHDWQGVALSFAATVLPIAAAYEIAHNYPYVAANLGRFAALLRSAVTGVPLDPIAPLGWLQLEAFWWSQVLFVVAGHTIAVIAAHRVALAHSESTSEARRLHAPLVVLMIGYTVLSLWIISQPIVG